jgi:hypothetical protein
MTALERLLDRLDDLDAKIDRKLDGMDGRLRAVETQCATLVDRSDAAESLDGRVRVLEQSGAKAKGERRGFKIAIALAAILGGGGAGAGVAKAVDAAIGSEDTDR